MTVHHSPRLAREPGGPGPGLSFLLCHIWVSDHLTPEAPSDLRITRKACRELPHACPLPLLDLGLNIWEDVGVPEGSQLWGGFCHIGVCDQEKTGEILESERKAGWSLALLVAAAPDSHPPCFPDLSFFSTAPFSSLRFLVLR